MAHFKNCNDTNRQFTEKETAIAKDKCGSLVNMHKAEYK